MNLKKIFLNTIIIIGISACSNTLSKPKIINSSISAQPTTSNEQGSILYVTIKTANSNTLFQNEILTLNLYKYNPMLADVPATLVDQYTKHLGKNDSQQQLNIQTTLNSKSEITAHEKYYITAIITNKNGQRTYYGYKNDQKGLAKVFQNNSDNHVVMILKPILATRR